MIAILEDCLCKKNKNKTQKQWSNELTQLSTNMWFLKRMMLQFLVMASEKKIPITLLARMVAYWHFNTDYRVYIVRTVI